MLQAYIFKCFSYFRCMFQVFHLNVAKVDMDVAYTCMLQKYVSSVSCVCCKCFIWMLHVFYNSYTHVLQVFLGVCKCFSCFGCMLQVFYLNVAKVNLVLHMQRDRPVATVGASCICVGSGGGWRQGHRRSRVCETGATRAPCMRLAQEAEGMEVGVHGPICMRLREVEGAYGVRTEGAEVHTCASTCVKWSSRRRRPDVSHTLLQLILFFFF
jgi:hypothetical protein